MNDKHSREIECIGCHKKFSVDLLGDRCRVTIKGGMQDFIPETWDICPECRRRKKRSVYSKFKSKQYLHDWARKIKTQFPTIGNVVTESRLRELGVELLIEAEADKSILQPVPKEKLNEFVEKKAEEWGYFSPRQKIIVKGFMLQLLKEYDKEKESSDEK